MGELLALLQGALVIAAVAAAVAVVEAQQPQPDPARVEED